MQLNEGKEKPDFLDVDKDGDKKESFKKAVKDKEAGAAKGKKTVEEELDESLAALAKKVGGVAKKAAGKAFDVLGGPDDEQLLKDLQKKVGVPQTGKKPQKTDEGWDDMMKDVARRSSAKKVGDITHGAKHDIETTATGRRVTRRVDPNTGYSVGAEDDVVAVKRGRGRPAGAKKALGAKGPSGKSKLMTREEIEEAIAALEECGYNVSKLEETEMGFDKVEKAVAKNPKVKNPAAVAAAIGRKKYGQKEMTRRSVAGRKDESEELDELSPGTIASYQKKAMPQAMDASNPKAGQRTVGLVRTIGRKSGEELDEKAVSKAQQKFMGMVHAAQKGEKPASKEVAKVAKSMGKKDAKDFAATKHKGLPEKVKSKKKKEESVEETSESPKSTGGFTFGKGIYDSLNREVEAMISESMNISMNMSSDANGGPTKSLTVTATEEDAVKLGALLKMAGVGQEATAPEYGEVEVVGENQPENTPDPVEGDGEMYAGGLNKPKSTGQTTGAPFNRQDQRQGVMAEDEDLSKLKEMAGIKEEAKPDFTDVDKDGDTEESWKKAEKDKEEKKVEESTLHLFNLWKRFKG